MKLLKTRTFTWQEIAGIKVTLLSLGILLALYYPIVLLNFLWVWWTIFILGLLYFLSHLLKGK